MPVRHMFSGPLALVPFQANVHTHSSQMSSINGVSDNLHRSNPVIKCNRLKSEYFLLALYSALETKKISIIAVILV